MMCLSLSGWGDAKVVAALGANGGQVVALPHT